MPSTTITVGELLYEVTVHFTKVTEYGVSLEADGGKVAKCSPTAPGALAPPPVSTARDGVGYRHGRSCHRWSCLPPLSFPGYRW